TTASAASSLVIAGSFWERLGAASYHAPGRPSRHASCGRPYCGPPGGGWGPRCALDRGVLAALPAQLLRRDCSAVSQQAFSDPPEAFGIDGRLIVSCGEVIEPTKPNPDCSLGTARGLIWEYPPKGDQLLS